MPNSPNITAIRSLRTRAVLQQDPILWMACQVAVMNYQTYGPLTPADIENLKKSWGE